MDHHNPNDDIIESSINITFLKDLNQTEIDVNYFMYKKEINLYALTV